MNKKTIKDIDVTNKRVLVRVDFNVPIAHGQVQDDTRIRESLPTIHYLIANKAKVILLSHLGRPKGIFKEEYSLKPVAKKLTRLLGREVKMCSKTICDTAKTMANALEPGEVMLLENVRFYSQEDKNEREFAKELSNLADVFVNDAFGAAHRNHASVVGVTEFLPSVAGFLLEKELTALGNLLEKPERPFVAILGGNKISDKLGVIHKFLDLVDSILIGGGMCFTFFKASGLEIGNSIHEDDELEHARQILRRAEANQIEIQLPVDLVVAKDTSPNEPYRVINVDKMHKEAMGLDIGPKSIERFSEVIRNSKTIFWNGPMGLFEVEQYSVGTKKVAKAIAATKATSIVGGGDTDAALRKFGLLNKITHVSTGGGASLKVLEGTPLPGVEALNER